MKKTTALALFAAGVVSLAGGFAFSAEPPTLGEKDYRVLFIDENGNPNSTNAIATQASLAAEAAKVNLALAKQEANEAGYAAATNLLGQVAASIGSQSTVVYYSVELTAFSAAVIFDEQNDKVQISGINPDQATTKTVNGELCQLVKLYFGFTADLQDVIPLIEYAEQLDGTPVDDWDVLAEDYYEAPVKLEGSVTLDGQEYDNVYSMNLWIPKSRAAGFFRVRVPNAAATGDGSTMDLPGDATKYTGTLNFGNATINVYRGHILVDGTSSGN